ncbi:hypothetical protein FBU59_002146 [Linderina macrospora]|uniref:Uncharacterized protein n=1 Tax=Linderina macrospora TaxID=4868 RepID=A0ACC1JCB4_9FUNG|nr:hypothetical protein FBU59_002146 [Linderina macrospora]
METGIIPGNRNLDNVTPELEAYDHMVGGEILVLNPEFAHAVLSKDALDQYCLKMEKREQKSNRYWQDVLVGNHPFAQLKDAPPFTPEQESRVYMDPTARAKYDPVSKKYHF